MKSKKIPGRDEYWHAAGSHPASESPAGTLGSSRASIKNEHTGCLDLNLKSRLHLESRRILHSNIMSDEEMNIDDGTICLPISRCIFAY